MSNETRRMPTRPGWWWRGTTNGMRISEVVDGYGGLVGAASGCPVADAPCNWLAPIPGPAVLAALAEYADALAACSALAAPEDYEDDTAMLTFEASRDARRALDAAIRAERDGGA